MSLQESYYGVRTVIESNLENYLFSISISLKNSTCKVTTYIIRKFLYYTEIWLFWCPETLRVGHCCLLTYLYLDIPVWLVIDIWTLLFELMQELLAFHLYYVYLNSLLCTFGLFFVDKRVACSIQCMHLWILSQINVADPGSVSGFGGSGW